MSGHGRAGAPPWEGAAHWEGEPVTAWAARWGCSRVEAYDVVGSTSDRVRALAAAGAEAPLVVLADEQRAGRGRAGRAWASPRGGLWASLLVEPAGQGSVLPLVVGLAVA
ncbi:MAG: hypothetical protein D6701_02645, partial [Gemmatimonadetes bacterium]